MGEQHALQQKHARLGAGQLGREPQGVLLALVEALGGEDDGDGHPLLDEVLRLEVGTAEGFSGRTDHRKACEQQG